MQHDEPLLRAGRGTETSPSGSSTVYDDDDRDHSDGDRPSPPFTALPRTRLRPLTRRAHVRLPGANAAMVERLAWGDTGQPDILATAISVVPGASLPVALRRDVAAGADLDVVLGTLESGCAPGRHRREHPAWSVLRRLPGWRRMEPRPDAAAAPDHIADDTLGGAVAAVDDATDDLAPDEPIDGDHDMNDGADPRHTPRRGSHPVSGGRAEDDDTAELPPVPAQHAGPPAVHAGHSSPSGNAAIPQPREASSDEPVWRRRRRRPPEPGLREALQAAQARIESAPGRRAIARFATEEGARLVEADVTALVLRAVEGPRVLWLHPGGPDADGLWGPATLAALLRVGQPVRRVVEGDPLADGEATALLTVPVPAGGGIAGTIVARRNEPRPFSATEQDVLSRLARMAGAALLAASRPGARAQEDLDGLTGLPGSQRFTADVEAAVRTSQRQGTPVAVLAVQVDGLSRLRTELGTDPADETLQTLADALGRALRVGDLAYRIGPDELALLLPATDETALDSVRARLPAVTAEVVAGLELPGGPPALTLRTAAVPLDGVAAGGEVQDTVARVLDLDRQKVRWTPAR